MRSARNIPQVMLQRYNQIRSKNTGRLICAFEGADDVAFYGALSIRLTGKSSYTPMVCDGKDGVLELRVILSRNVAADAQNVLFFIDKDFDGLKGHNPGRDLYCTPTYSIENLLIDIRVVETLMRGEYRCNDEDGDEEVRRIADLYKDRLEEFLVSMRGANQLIHYARAKAIRLSSIDNDIKKYVRVSLDAITQPNPATPAWQLVGLPHEVKPEELADCEPLFDRLDRVRDWRGKFIFSFFRRFLADLKEDRGSRAPQYFKKRASMSFVPQGDIIRTLASIIAIPPCLELFIGREMSGATH